MHRQKLSSEILTAALQGLEAQKDRIDAHIAQVKRILGVRRNGPAAPPEAPKRKRKLSVAGRKHIAAVQRERWAKWRKQKGAAAKQ
jgi:hypothetical protein